MDKEEVYKFLKNKNIKFETVEHQAVFNMDEVSKIDLDSNNRYAKNLFVRDDKKDNYYLLTVRGDKRVNLKEFRKKYGTRRLVFASEEDLYEKLKLEKGSVSPLGLLNNIENDVNFFVDEDFISESLLIGIHPNKNTATVWINVKDLISLIEEKGNSVYICKF